MSKLPFTYPLKNCRAPFYAIILPALLISILPSNSAAQVTAIAPYSVTTFATAPTGLSAPDSVTFSATNIFIGYGNGGMPDGSDNAMSNVVEYDFKGNLIENFTVVGHNDGLRFNPMTNELWALQNEDGMAN